jgi:DNA-binding CsgD family transcriptional regulator
VIFISGKTAVPEIVRAMRAGAIDFLIKPVDEAQLLNAIKSAEEWDKTRRSIEARRKIVLQKIAKLTEREKEVLALMVVGMQSKAIGEKLGVAEKTIKVHRGRIQPEDGRKKPCRASEDDARDIYLRSRIVDFHAATEERNTPYTYVQFTNLLDRLSLAVINFPGAEGRGF